MTVNARIFNNDMYLQRHKETSVLLLGESGTGKKLVYQCELRIGKII